MFNPRFDYILVQNMIIDKVWLFHKKKLNKTNIYHDVYQSVQNLEMKKIMKIGFGLTKCIVYLKPIFLSPMTVMS